MPDPLLEKGERPQRGDAKTRVPPRHWSSDRRAAAGPIARSVSRHCPRSSEESMIMSRAGARVLLLSVGLFLGERSAQAGPIYVNASAKPGGAHDGTSWKTAFVSLQDALDVAGSASPASCGPLAEIWVAAGTYAPSKIYAPSGVAGGKYGTTEPPP